MTWAGRLAESMIVWAVAFSIKNGSSGQLAEVREAFDRQYSHWPEDRRRDVWQRGAERAAQ